eukprot:4492498-Alexandrium_andersonii.AAC.1
MALLHAVAATSSGGRSSKASQPCVLPTLCIMAVAQDADAMPSRVFTIQVRLRSLGSATVSAACVPCFMLPCRSPMTSC